MTEAVAAGTINDAREPSPRLHLVDSRGDLMARLNAARGDYANAIRRRQEVAAALERCRIDGDTSMMSRRAALAYIQGRDVAEEGGGDADALRARAAAAAMPELRKQLKEALDAEVQARGGLRAAISNL